MAMRVFHRRACYFGRPLSSLTAADADKAALLAGIPKAPRDYAPTADAANVLRRRNQTLTLMAANGFLTPQRLAEVIRRPIPIIAARPAWLFMPRRPLAM